MPDGLFTLCEGNGCLLRERCSRYIYGKDVDREAEGYMWIPGCNEETRDAYLPINKTSHE